MTRDAEVYVADILECICKIEQYTEGINRDDFMEDTHNQDAVFRRLEVIGEAVKGIPQEVRDKYPDIQWKEIAGLRDILIHGYFGVKTDRIWKVIEKDLPELKQQMLRVYQDLASSR